MQNEATSKKKRITRAEKKRRVTEVLRLMLKGADRARVLQYVADNWELSERSADYYIKAATDIIAEQEQEKAEHEIALIHAQFRELLFEAHKKKDRYFALQVLREIAKLKGAYAPSKTALTDVGGEALQGIVYLPAVDFARIGKAESGESDEPGNDAT